ncbi:MULTISPECIES: GNAT family N-acetyltransferase [unclassified Rubrivivax]|uniref:GNAT family N-acetyltransferase n=1 Tax=unclassified Rubrivivax TaxID=2649762 RepID=UPI001E3A579E|nr:MULTISPECIES: GNAT family N-acetyltransferase [unclassified Rubrivivax]MCC9595790.1 GNAT family N-acetyltransferase [Rubrivivax sp. JA1055]MCC9647870.1 GNAT family N-acetyltransferase [Rubrivivax sp. JA1029]
MPSRLRITPLRPQHLDELAAALRHPAVYEHIGGEVPSAAEFHLALERALVGPPPGGGQRWFNYLVRHADSRTVLGRLEATVVGRVAEVAFLFAPGIWGNGYASEGLAWLHEELRREAGDVDFWATTLPANRRCQALLRRAGYVEVPAAVAPVLQSYDAGDLVFHRAGLPGAAGGTA